MQKIISIKKLVQGGGPNPNLNPNLENIHTRARAHTHTYTHERAHYRAALDELSLSVPGSSSQQELFCFVRYMNAILHSLCNGPYADGQNPMLFLSNWGLAAGRPLAIIPTLPFLVWEGIRLWDMSLRRASGVRCR